MILVVLYALSLAFLIARAGVWVFNKLSRWPSDDAGVSGTVIPFPSGAGGRVPGVVLHPPARRDARRAAPFVERGNP